MESEHANSDVRILDCALNLEKCLILKYQECFVLIKKVLGVYRVPKNTFTMKYETCILNISMENRKIH